MNYKQLLNNITAFIFDVDGVLTDGSLYITELGEHTKAMNIKDGFALQLAVKKEYKVAIISGTKNEGIIKRLQALGIKDLYMGRENKYEVFVEYVNLHKIKLENILYMGDDIPDYKIMKEVGLSSCPKDAAEDIKMIAKYISNKKGGKGCVRDIVEQVMRVQGKWIGIDNNATSV